MKKPLPLVLVSLLPIFAACNSNDKVVKIFISSSQEVDINKMKETYQPQKLEVSYSNPESTYYSFLYKASREKGYDIFVLRDNEYVESDIKNIFVPFDEDNISYLGEKTHTFYEIDNVKYGIKLNDGDYQINEHISFEEGHDYYLSLAKFSKHVGKYSSYSTKSYLAFEFLTNLL